MRSADLEIAVAEIGTRIAQALGTRSQADCAREAGICPRRMSRLVAGASLFGPDPVEFRKLARELMCSPQWLAFGVRT